MDKRHLTSRKARRDAGFNKLPVREAKFCSNKINDLHVHHMGATSLYAVHSYKSMTWGISGQRRVICRHFQALRARSRTSMRTLSGMGVRSSRLSALNHADSSKCLSMTGVTKRERVAYT